MTLQTNLFLHSSIGLLALLSAANVQALDVTGRVSVVGSIARPHSDDFRLNEANWQGADQQTLRLMLEGGTGAGEWVLHSKLTRQHYQNLLPADGHSSDRFRYQTLAGSWLDEHDANSATLLGHEVDRAYYRYQHDKVTLTAGRQPIDWGSGRFWQPLNVFGAFAPVDLDTEYKPGIDAFVVDWFPGEFSTLTATYVFSPHADADSGSSLVLHYRRPLGEQSELALLAGRVDGDRVAGFGVESELKGVGVRLEAVHHELPQQGDKGVFAVMGADYKFENGTVLTTELYHNQFGAYREQDLPAATQGMLFTRGLQPHLSRHVLGVGVQREITPLLNGGYTLLASRLDDAAGDSAYSFLHQVNLTYSLGNESDLVFSLLNGTGKGLDAEGKLQSEFGHVAPAFTVRWSRYF